MCTLSYPDFCRNAVGTACGAVLSSPELAMWLGISHDDVLDAASLLFGLYGQSWPSVSDELDGITMFAIKGKLLLTFNYTRASELIAALIETK